MKKTTANKFTYLTQQTKKITPTRLIYLAVVLLVISLISSLYTPLPNTITISAGPQGSLFNIYARQYQRKLQPKGIEVVIQESTGSLQNLERLLDPNSGVDIGLVQAGITLADEDERVMSLGTMFYVPLTIYYHKSLSLERLAELQGKNVSIGEEGSGTQALARALLRANGIGRRNDTTNTQLIHLNTDEAVEALLNQEVDAVFLSGDSATFAGLRKLRNSPEIATFNFTDQAETYVKRFRYLNKIDLPVGAYDLVDNYPEEPTTILAPKVELLATKDLNPALIDLLVDATQEVHGRGTLFQEIGEFPAMLQQHWPLSQEARRYLQDGKNFLYHYLPFSMASFLSRIFILIAPLLVLLMPIIPLVPKLLRWRIETRIHRQYQQLVTVEREIRAGLDEEKLDYLRRWLNDIEQAIMNLRIIGAYTEKVYILRQHLAAIRQRLEAQAANPDQELPDQQSTMSLMEFPFNHQN